MEDLKTKETLRADTALNAGCGIAPSTKNATFSQALQWLRQGYNVKRAIWGGHWFMATDVYCQAPSPNHAGYVRGFSFKELIVAVLKDCGGCAPAQPYQADILANDWEIYFG